MTSRSSNPWLRLLLPCSILVGASPLVAAGEDIARPSHDIKLQRQLDLSLQSIDQATQTGGGDRLVLLRSVWGNLPVLPGATGAQLWPGFVSSTHGLTVPLAAVEFELSDQLLRQIPPNVLQWSSATYLARDGLITATVFPDLPPRRQRPEFVTFFTPHVSATWDVDSVGQINANLLADPTGNMVSLVGLEPVPGWPAGFANGSWNQGDPTQPEGLFSGVLTDVADAPLLVIQGFWVPTGSGGGQMFGVIALADGTQVGNVVGNYVPNAWPQPGGLFQAFWLDLASGLPIAQLDGNYADSPLTVGGHFQARWMIPVP